MIQFFTAPTALGRQGKLVSDFDEFSRSSTSSPSTFPAARRRRHLLNRERLFDKCRPNLLVVNDARGEVVDEFALADALKEKEDCRSGHRRLSDRTAGRRTIRLFGIENAVLTPHLGASTDEAQTAVSVDACKAISRI